MLKSISTDIFRICSQKNPFGYIKDVISKRGNNPWSLSIDSSIRELEKRKKNEKLKAEVEQYLKHDIPDHFKSGSIFYLARHVPTPNFETLRFADIKTPSYIQKVISIDSHDIFAPKNNLKKSLGKMPVHYEKSKKGEVTVEYRNYTIIDFNTYAGKRFCDVQTVWKEPLIDFHLSLCDTFLPTTISIYDDSAWINRNSRENILEHYKKFLALFLVHGILAEDFLRTGSEKDFTENVFIPAFRFIKEKFGFEPLITDLLPHDPDSEYWSGYPYAIGEVIKSKLR